MNTTLLFMGIGTQEFLFLALIILLLFGGKKIPELMKGIGKGVRSFKEGMNEVEDNLKETDQNHFEREKRKITAVKPTQPTELTFWDHLDELRKTIIHIACAVIVLMLLAFCFKEELFGLILAPKEGDFCTYRFFAWLGKILHIAGLEAEALPVKLINTQLSGQFLTHMSVSFYAGILLASPYILYQLFHFISPALYQNEKKYSRWLIFWGYLLFLTGVLFSYFLIFPFTFRFLSTYQVSQEVENTILLSSYIDTLNTLSLMMGITFEIPILTWLLAKLGILSADFMAQYRKHAWVVAMIIAAIITPTSDVFTMLIVTFPIVLLYEVSIFLVRHTVKKRRTKGEN